VVLDQLQSALHRDWRAGLPTLRGRRVVLRAVRRSDAPALFAALATEEVARFISTPPDSAAGFEAFILWSDRQRAAGAAICYAVTLDGSDTPVGIFQVRQITNGFETAEWGFALASACWGTGVFQESAELVLEFAFEVLGAQRIEARATTVNGRGQGALLKLGATHEGILRCALRRGDRTFDQALYAILEAEWRANRGRIPASSSTHVH